MASNTVFHRSIIWVVLLAFTTACSTARPIAATDPKSLIDQVSVGDRIEVKRKDGSQLKFKVTEVSLEGLRGREEFVLFTDIGQVQISEQIHPAAVVFVVLLGVSVLWMLKEGVDCGDLLNPCYDE